jgi:hypothetical protein
MSNYYDFENSGIFGVPNQILWNTGTKLLKNPQNPHEVQPYMCAIGRLKACHLCWGSLGCHVQWIPLSTDQRDIFPYWSIILFCMKLNFRLVQRNFFLPQAVKICNIWNNGKFIFVMWIFTLWAGFSGQIKIINRENTVLGLLLEDGLVSLLCHRSSFHT